MKCSKKSAISLEMVVIAAICLFVLIVLMVIFSARMSGWNSGMNHCDTVCKATTDECAAAGYTIPVMIGSCEDTLGGKFKENAYCCKEKKKE